MKKKCFLVLSIIVISLLVIFLFNHQSMNEEISIKTQKCDTDTFLIIRNNSKKTLDIVSKDNKKLIECLFPNGQSVIKYNNNDFDPSIYKDIKSVKNTDFISYNDYEENIEIDCFERAYGREIYEAYLLFCRRRNENPLPMATAIPMIAAKADVTRKRSKKGNF